jgi:sugar/nucleoside kinase (ribokinase family)
LLAAKPGILCSVEFFACAPLPYGRVDYITPNEIETVALSEGMDVVAAARFGCATAGISITRPGTAPSMPARAEIDALLK